MGPAAEPKTGIKSVNKSTARTSFSHESKAKVAMDHLAESVIKQTDRQLFSMNSIE